MEELNSYVLTIEDRQKLSLSGVSSVDGFSSNQINVSLKSCKVVILGENLKIVNFSKSNGSFSAIGTINSIKYLSSSDKFIKKLFR